MIEPLPLNIHRVGRKRDRMRRFHIKRGMIEYKGGRCVDCGGSFHPAAMHFHHVSNNKEFGISSRTLSSDIAALKVELDKCILLCANCHAVRHWKGIKD